MQQLTEDFLIDLAKTCITNKEILEVIKPHLQYSFLPTEQYKSIFKYIFEYHTLKNIPPTIGELSQTFADRDSMSIIAAIKNANTHDNKSGIVEKFEWFIRKSKLYQLYKRVEETNNSGDVDKAIEINWEGSKDIYEFSLLTEMHPGIFAGFDKRMEERQNRDFLSTKIRTGIPQFDYHTRGGPEFGTSLLAIARSGVGKTTFLRSLGFHAAFRGFNVLHFSSADSTQREVEEGYDSAWTGIDMHEIREGKITGITSEELEKIRNDYLNLCGEIYVHAFAQFNRASIFDCRNILIEMMKKANIKLVLFDYLEKFDPGDGKKYSANMEGNMARKMAIAEKIVGIATEFNLVTATVTQASEVHKDIWNDPTKVLTRSNIANLKATVDPFAYCITLNQTDDENDKDIMRIHEEKIRHHKTKSFASTYKIAQDRSVGRFIDVAKTNELYWDVEKKQIIRTKIKA